MTRHAASMAELRRVSGVNITAVRFKPDDGAHKDAWVCIVDTPHGVEPLFLSVRLVGQTTRLLWMLRRAGRPRSMGRLTADDRRKIKALMRTITADVAMFSALWMTLLACSAVLMATAVGRTADLADLLPWRVIAATHTRPERGGPAQWTLYVDRPIDPSLLVMSEPHGGFKYHAGDSRTFRSPYRLNKWLARIGYPVDPPLTAADGRAILHLLHELAEESHA